MADNAQQESKRVLRVFLCHATGDKPAVRKLYQRLCAEGIDAWLDEEKLLPGRKWQSEISKAVRASDAVIVCLSPKSINKAGYVQKEIKFALDVADEQPEGAIFLIPARLEECDVPDRLREWHWVSLFEERGYDRLMRALRARAAELGASLSQAPASPLASLPPQPQPSQPDKIGIPTIITALPPQPVEPTPTPTHLVSAGSSAAPPSSQASVPQAAPVSTPRNTQMFGGLEFVRVPKGKFIMGSKDDDKRAQNAEKPQHTVEIPYDYWIARYPVTNGQFEEFSKATQYVTTAEKEGGWSPGEAKFVKGFDWRHPLGPKSSLKDKGDHPVLQVSWHDAVAYCKWLNEKLRAEIGDEETRLPTEAEWEKAARGERGNEWPWGNEFDKTKCNSSEGGKGGAMPVGAYSPQGDSPYGAADMAGNVWEWCHSIARPYPYKADDGREQESGSDLRVLRGGAWNGFWNGARCAFRYRDDPQDRNLIVGLRVVVAPNSRF